MEPFKAVCPPFSDEAAAREAAAREEMRLQRREARDSKTL